MNLTLSGSGSINIKVAERNDELPKTKYGKGSHKLLNRLIWGLIKEPMLPRLVVSKRAVERTIDGYNIEL